MTDTAFAECFFVNIGTKLAAHRFMGLVCMKPSLVSAYFLVKVNQKKIMKSTIQPPPGQKNAQDAALPVTFAILGASVVLMAVMLLSGSGRHNRKEKGSYDVENYDVVGNQPFIYGIAE